MKTLSQQLDELEAAQAQVDGPTQVDKVKSSLAADLDSIGENPDLFRKKKEEPQTNFDPITPKPTAFEQFVESIPSVGESAQLGARAFNQTLGAILSPITRHLGPSVNEFLDPYFNQPKTPYEIRTGNDITAPILPYDETSKKGLQSVLKKVGVDKKTVLSKIVNAVADPVLGLASGLTTPGNLALMLAMGRGGPATKVAEAAFVPGMVEGGIEGTRQAIEGAAELDPYKALSGGIGGALSTAMGVGIGRKVLKPEMPFGPVRPLSERAEPRPELPIEPRPELPIEPRPELPIEPRPELPIEPRPELPIEPRPELPVEPQTPKSPERLNSRVFERLKEEHPEMLEGDVTYEKLSLKQGIQEGVDLLKSDPKKAYKIAMGMEPAETPAKANLINIAMAEQALTENNAGLYSKLIKKRTMDLTEAGQLVVSEKASVTDNDTARYVKELLNSRMDKIGNSYLEKIKSKFTGETKSKRVMKIIDGEVEKVSGHLRGKALDIAEAQRLIDSLACK